ncbi:uncharacterized protein LOC135705318 [Ochlerotatus camptorhynchus]|uniref:uncharacterized protein LOC135705318 n=1 Tax=Ochlerotatus camptorhynchus TaxID=644619 RepID=UPI0031CF5943
MFKLHVICVIFLFAILNWSSALPVKDQEVEDLIYKLQQLKQLNDVSQIAPTDLHRGGGEKERSHLAPDPNSVGSMKTKRSLNNSDRRTLLYNYYARGLAPMYDKRNFDEIDRYSTFGGKRNYDFMDLNDRQNTVKRNFDEIDRHAGFNSRLRNDRNMKRNFDEIDRYGKFNKRLFREVEDFNGAAPNSHMHGSSLADEMAVINEYSQ